MITGVRHMSANVHGLLHLPDVVADLGPLWAHSCFPYETANGRLLKLFHGSQGVNKQVKYWCDNITFINPGSQESE